jgi:hypothetical protein
MPAGRGLVTISARCGEAEVQFDLAMGACSGTAVGASSGRSSGVAIANPAARAALASRSALVGQVLVMVGTFQTLRVNATRLRSVNSTRSRPNDA